MTVIASGQLSKKELTHLGSHLRSLAKEMRSLTGDEADFREKLQKLSVEVKSVGFRLRRFS